MSTRRVRLVIWIDSISPVSLQRGYDADAHPSICFPNYAHKLSARVRRLLPCSATEPCLLSQLHSCYALPLLSSLLYTRQVFTTLTARRRSLMSRALSPLCPCCIRPPRRLLFSGVFPRGSEGLARLLVQLTLNLCLKVPWIAGGRRSAGEQDGFSLLSRT